MPTAKGKPTAGVSSVILRVIEQVSRSRRYPPYDSSARAVADLSRLFTKDRESLSRQYLDDPEHAGAYLNYFLPVNLSKIQVLLDELPGETSERKEDNNLRLLDVGSGPGTGALAVLDWLRYRHPERAGRLSAMSIDASEEALHLGESLWNTYCSETGIEGARLVSETGNLERFAGKSGTHQIQAAEPYDLIILANCLNELFIESDDPVAMRVSLIREFLDVLAPHGTIMIVEPASRNISRGLHQIRDRLVQEKRCTIYSPCLHERNCPALTHPDDWCHEERPWEPPVSIQETDRKIGFIKDSLKFSYLLLRTDGLMIASRSPQTFRIVSELRKMKGDTRAWVCNELGRSEVGRLDRAKSGPNAAWEECERGTIVRIEGLKRKERSMLERIPVEGMVEIVRPV